MVASRTASTETVRWYADNEAWWRPIKSGEHHQAYYAQNYADRSAFAR